MLKLNNLSEPIPSPELIKLINKAQSKKKTIIYTTAHIDKLYNEFITLLTTYIGISNDYKIYITTGGLDATKTYIYAALTAFKKITKQKPNILLCSPENSDIYTYLQQIKINGGTTINSTQVNIQGKPTTPLIEKSIIAGQTCLCIASIGSSIFSTDYSIKNIAEAVHKYRVPLHIDASGLVGFSDMRGVPADSFYMDFRYILNINIGILCINQSIIDGYQLQKIAPDFTKRFIGNIEPTTIINAITTLKYIYNGRESFFKRCLKLKQTIFTYLTTTYKLINFIDWIKSNNDISDFIIMGDPNIITSIYTNCLTIIPLNYISTTLTKQLTQSIQFTSIPKQVINHYKTIFRELFTKCNKPLSIFDNLLVISWNDKMTRNQINGFIKKIKNSTYIINQSANEQTNNN
jgi:hypothetical protein